MPDIYFDRFYRYEELTNLLAAYAKEYPQLVRVQSIGKAFRARKLTASAPVYTALARAELGR